MLNALKLHNSRETIFNILLFFFQIYIIIFITKEPQNFPSFPFLGKNII